MMNVHMLFDRWIWLQVSIRVSFYTGNWFAISYSCFWDCNIPLVLWKHWNGTLGVIKYLFVIGISLLGADSNYWCCHSMKSPVYSFSSFYYDSLLFCMVSLMYLCGKKSHFLPCQRLIMFLIVTDNFLDLCLLENAICGRIHFWIWNIFFVQYLSVYLYVYGLALRFVWIPCLKRQEAPVMWIQGIYYHPFFLLNVATKECRLYSRFLNIRPNVSIVWLGKIVLDLRPGLIYVWLMQWEHEFQNPLFQCSAPWSISTGIGSRQCFRLWLYMIMW